MGLRGRDAQPVTVSGKSNSGDWKHGRNRADRVIRFIQGLKITSGKSRAEACRVVAKHVLWFANFALTMSAWILGTVPCRVVCLQFRLQTLFTGRCTLPKRRKVKAATEPGSSQRKPAFLYRGLSIQSRPIFEHRTVHSRAHGERHNCRSTNPIFPHYRY